MSVNMCHQLYNNMPRIHRNAVCSKLHVLEIYMFFKDTLTPEKVVPEFA